MLRPVSGEGDPSASGEIVFGRIAPYPRDKWSATASSAFEQGQSTPNKALDGVKKTFWTPGAAQARGQWLQVDMGEELEFSRLQLDAEYLEPQAAPTAFRVLASSDGQQWREIAVGAGKLVTDIYLPQAVTARHLRFELTADSPGWWAVREVLAFPRRAGKPRE
jgi:hypothetical protein